MVFLIFCLKYQPDVKSIDIPKLDASIKKQIKLAIETRLTSAPQQYGKPLRRTLKGYWKLRVGEYRVVFKIVKNDIRVFGMIHRKEVYEKIKKRTESC